MQYHSFLISLIVLIIASLGFSTINNSTEPKYDPLDELIKNEFRVTEMDNSDKTVTYYRDGNLEQNQLFLPNLHASKDYVSTAEHCMNVLNATNPIGSMNEFYRDIKMFDFTNNEGCSQYQSIWKRERNATDCYETLDIGKLANVQIRASTVVDPRVYTIIEKFMKEVVEETGTLITSFGLNADKVLIDRPTTIMYFILQAIRNKEPELIGIPLKLILKEIERLTNGNLPLFKTSRDMFGSRNVSIDMLYLVKPQNTADVRSLSDLGIEKIFVNDNQVDNKYLIQELVWEQLDKLFEVCKHDKE